VLSHLSHLGQQVPPQRLLARLGRGRLRRVRAYHDIAPAVSAIFAS
jgi:hypothetical protein